MADPGAASGTASLSLHWRLSDCLEAPAAERSGFLTRARERIDLVEPRVRAFVELDPRAGTTPPPSGPLSGVPVAVKDIIDVAGLATRCGATARRHAPPAARDADVVTALRSVGAVPIGKSVTTEYAYFAPGPTDNPAAPGHTPGGSSSGSAAAVAAGMVPLAVGSQTAGSLTRPAAYCGVAGLVVTRGALPGAGVVGLSESCDSLGLLAADVADLEVAAEALGVIATGASTAECSPAGSVLLWLPDLGVEPAMVAAIGRAAGLLAEAGTAVTPLDASGHQVAARMIDAQQVVMAYEAARQRAAEHARGGLSAALTELLDAGKAMSQGQYEDARAVLADAAVTVAGWFAGYTAVLAPAALGPAPRGLAATGSPVLSRGWQGLGLPAVTVPGLRHEDGRPLGVQLIGAGGAEQALLRLGRRLQQAIPR